MNYFIETLNENKKQLEPHLHHQCRRSSEFSNLLIPLLTALNWKMAPHEFLNALPYHSDVIEELELRNTLARLNFKSNIIHKPLEQISPRFIPYIYIPQGSSALLVLEHNGIEYTVWNSVSQKIEQINSHGLKGTAYTFTKDITLQSKTQAWLKQTLKKFQPQLIQIMIITLFINLLTLITPLFILFAYDYILPNHSLSLLLNLACGTAFVLIVNYLLERNRHHVLHFLSSRMDKFLAETVLHKIIHLPSSYIENARMSDQVNRIKSFDHIYNFISSPWMQALLEIPSMIAAFIMIVILAGQLAWIPFIGITFLFVGYTFYFRKSQNLQKQFSATRQQRDHLLSESFQHHTTIKMHTAEETWATRFKNLQTLYNLSHLRMNFIQRTINIVVDTTIHLIMITTIVFATQKMLASNLRPGEMLAILILTWRILSPMKTIFNFLPNWNNFTNQIHQFNHLMRLPSEITQSTTSAIFTTKKGVLELSKINFRYQSTAPFALHNISIKIPPKQIVALTGRNGSGKSTLLKLIPRFYYPQMGDIYLDGINVQHIPVVELRQQIAYLPQINQIFTGTIKENLLSVNPMASNGQLIEAVTLAGIYEDIQQLPKKFQTILDDYTRYELPYHFVQGLALARTYLKSSRLYLFDEPAAGLTYNQNQTFIEVVEELKKNATIIIATHRPEHLDISDQVIHLEQGQIQYNDPTEKIIHQLSMEML